jgi:hypothetical protein
MTEALAVREGTLVEATPLPVFGGAAMVQALEAYRNLQASLDRAMPDQIMQLDGRPFRKKGYWRAVAVAFHLTVEPVSETREVNSHFDDGRENFGWVVSYKVTAPNGRSAVGDGSCFAIEKARRFRCPHPESPGSRRTLHFPAETCPDYDPAFSWKSLPPQATEHNIRSHAHTRAMNRAVSNLVGFGEVSAEEMDRDEHHTTVSATTAAAPAVPSTSPAMPTSDGRPAGTVKVKAVKDEAGVSKPKKDATGVEQPGKPYIRYLVTFDDGRIASTFKQADAEKARTAAGQGAWVAPVLEQKGNFLNLMAIEIVVAAQASKATEDKEPVGTPEKILMRPIASVTPEGKRWMIQSNKRTYYTTAEAIADYAEMARGAKIEVIIAFEARPDARGEVFNVITAMNEVPQAPSILESEFPDDGPQEGAGA